MVWYCLSIVHSGNGSSSEYHFCVSYQILLIELKRKYTNSRFTLQQGWQLYNKLLKFENYKIELKSQLKKTQVWFFFRRKTTQIFIYNSLEALSVWSMNIIQLSPLLEDIQYTMLCWLSMQWKSSLLKYKCLLLT
jgi:hypothetical protein